MAALLAELRAIGYNPQPIKRATRAMHNARMRLASA
jgi:hypothetical protein